MGTIRSIYCFYTITRMTFRPAFPEKLVYINPEDPNYFDDVDRKEGISCWLKTAMILLILSGVAVGGYFLWEKFQPESPSVELPALDPISEDFDQLQRLKQPETVPEKEIKQSCLSCRWCLNVFT